ncbi:DUF192 domain-containing protein [Nanoarchaeota archaeon]
MFLFGCTKTNQVTVHGDEKVKFEVEVADTFAKQTKGLMFRKSLDGDKGMLFVFNSPNIKRFWMMNTSVALDIIFIDEDKKIVNIEEAEPCGLIPCKLYNSTGEALYVLEINQGLSKEYGFKEGDRVEFDLE